MQEPWRDQLTHPRDWIAQGTTGRYPVSGSYQLTDEAGIALSQGQVSTVSLTIYDLEVSPPVPIPGTWPRDVKTANGGSLSQTGGYVLVVPQADNGILHPTDPQTYERRRWALLYTYASGAKTKVIEVDRVIAKRTT